MAKRYIESVDRDVYFEDVRLQMEAKLWGEEYNRHKPPKQVCGAPAFHIPTPAQPRSGAEGDGGAGQRAPFFSVLAAGNKTHCLWSLTGQVLCMSKVIYS